MDARVESSRWLLRWGLCAVVLVAAGGLSACNDSRAGVCLYAGQSYISGESFKSIDGCNTCSCSSDGTVACTKRACVDGGGFTEAGGDVAGGETCHDTSSGEAAEGGETSPGVCSLETSYRFYDDGGERAFYDDSRIAPPRHHTITRKSTTGATATDCTYEIPCNRGAAVDLGAIQKAIAHADVQDALAKAMRPHYGSDPRPADGTIWVFERSDGRGFSIGGGNVPAGLRALETLLRQLTTETRAAPQCAALRP